MKREVRYGMIAELTPLIGKWWETQGCEDADIPYVSEKTFVLMAESAVNILCANYDIETFFRRNKMLNEEQK